ncbi:unnamed protein product [Hyaloperonospora brassicae]|uniref:Transmembrane protein n=1 Tax=Hyaloperonospora brassicae TaxID=162125 RepID=A0AAV0UJR9_HYABA|nr:unnamed protein product [Hyaloperonospora brassicae]
MDTDDESTMMYFLPDGIADDSPRKKTQAKASFGAIGGRSAPTERDSSTATFRGDPAHILTASVAPNLRSNTRSRELYAHRRPALETSPFGSNGSSIASNSPSSFFPSNLGGEGHGPRVSGDFGDSGRSILRSSGHFGVGRPYGSRLSADTEAMRLRTSVFDREQKAAKSFVSAQREFERSTGVTGSYGTVAQHYYRGEISTPCLNTRESDASCILTTTKTWPVSGTTSQPRRLLRRPPGLAGPPGLEESSMVNGAQSYMNVRGGSNLIQSPAYQTQSDPYHYPTPSRVAGGRASSTDYLSGKDQGNQSLPYSSSSSSGAYGNSLSHDQTHRRAAPNRESVEPNTHSVKVRQVDGRHARQAAGSSSAMHDSRTPTTSRRVDVQSMSKTPWSLKKARHDRNKSEGSSNLRVNALEFSTDAMNVLRPRSPARPNRSDRWRDTASPMTASSSSSNENYRSSSDSSGPRGGGRYQASNNGESSPMLGTVSKESRVMETASRAKTPGSLVTSRHVESDSPVESATLESCKPRRHEESKVPSRGTSTMTSARVSEKGAGITGRQVYRKKKRTGESSKDVTVPDEVAPTFASAPLSLHTVEASSEGITTGGGLYKHGKNSARDTASSVSPKTSETISDMDDIAEPDSTTVKRTVGKHGESASSRGVDAADDDKGISLVAGSSHGTPAADSANSTERGQLSCPSTSYSDGTKEPCILQSDATRATVSVDQELGKPKKSGRKEAVLAVPRTENSNSRATTAAVVASLFPGSPSAANVDKEDRAKEHNNEKTKKEKTEKKKTSRAKKHKRQPSLVPAAADATQPDNLVVNAQEETPKVLSPKSLLLFALITRILRIWGSAAYSAGQPAFVRIRNGYARVVEWFDANGPFAAALSYVESVLAMVVSMLLLFSLHAVSWFIHIHRVAFRAIVTHHHIGFSFAFLYGFPYLVQHVFPWAPPWAPVCLWYAFLVQLFCTNGPTAIVTTFRVIIPLVFLIEGISHHSFLLDLNGAELLLTSFIISALKTSSLCSPIFFLSLATQCLLAVFLGSELIVQWLQLALALYSLHAMAASDDEWIGIREEEDDLSCRLVSMHHSIATYNHRPAPSGPVSVQKTKRPDLRALAYARGRKARQWSPFSR